jgi:hypothetical protein
LIGWGCRVGTLVYFKGGTSRATGSLENWIVLNPQWLADVFKTLITFKHNFVQARYTSSGFFLFRSIR